MNGVEVLERFIDDNASKHRHIDPDQVRALWCAADEFSTVERVHDIAMDSLKLILSCRVCSAIKAESSPDYAARGLSIGHRGVS
ncbi:MAG TPA: hypothetical protein VJJ78_04630 [Candidatus Saccharimonadales bacterium]|nr:hypothetical protein [Candidatus Saccharimonadales bacterium]